MSLRLIHVHLAIALLCGVLGACQQAPFRLPDIPAEPTEARFLITIDPEHPSLQTNLLVPQSDPVTITGESGSLQLEARAKWIPNRPGILWVEIFIENLRETGLRDVSYSINGLEGSLFDLRSSPYGDATSTREFEFGGISPQGIGRIHVGFAPSEAPLEFELRVQGLSTMRTSVNSAPLALSPDGSEVWVALPDAEQVVIVDASADRRIASLETPGRPSGVAISPDGLHVMVSHATANQVTVYDRSSREILQTFGEADGIGREPRHVAMSPDGSTVLVSGYVGDTLTLLRRRGTRYAVEDVIEVGRRPSGIAIEPNSRFAYVSHFLPRGRVWENASWISVVDLERARVIREPEFRDVLNLDTAYCLADVFGASPQRFTADASRHALAGVFLDPAGNHGWIPHGAQGPAPVFERGPNSVEVSPQFSPRPAESVSGLVSVLDTHRPEEASPLLNPGNLERPVDPSYLACARFPLEIEGSINDPIPGFENQTSDHFAANPVGYTALASTGIQRFIAFTAGGRRALVLSHITDTLMMVDASTFHPTTREHLTLPGNTPLGMVISRDGSKAWVSYENSLFLSAFDLSAYAEPNALPEPSFVPYEYRDVPELVGGQNGIGTKRLVRHLSDTPLRPNITETAQIILLDEDPLDPVMRRGRILFTSSNTEKYPSLSAVTMTSCASCHVAGGTDGSMWATMEGERKTMGLWGGTRNRGWLHISATHRDIESFADLVVRERLGGQLSFSDQDALSRYVADGIPTLQSPRVDEALAAQGELLFAEHCASCHLGERQTSGLPDPSDPLGGGMMSGPILYDIGTAVDDARVALAPFLETLLPEQEAEILRLCRGDRDLGEGDPLQALLDFRQRPTRLRGEFKAPDLTNVWDHTLFLHDGRFDRLEDVVHFFVETLELPLDDADERAIVEYLRTL